MLDPESFGYLPVTEVESRVLSGFCCSKPHLDKFLTDTASMFHKDRLGFTNVVFHHDFSGPVAFFTLSNDAIPLNSSEKFELGISFDVPLNSFPAVKIGRLAVHKELQGNGIGSFVMNLIVGEIVGATSLSAGRLIVVDADNETRVLNFYERLGFEKSLWAEDHAKHHSKKGKPPASVKMHKDILTF